MTIIRLNPAFSLVHWNQVTLTLALIYFKPKRNFGLTPIPWHFVWKPKLIALTYLRFSEKMPLKESYVIWNNKGGVGKTTLTFHMATQYAKSNPNVNVLVIDLCPQANVSMALLSSPEKEGDELLASLSSSQGLPAALRMFYTLRGGRNWRHRCF